MVFSLFLNKQTTERNVEVGTRFRSSLNIVVDDGAKRRPCKALMGDAILLSVGCVAQT
jgi:hypothetical protein